jgi:PPOX class probable F420-dependent enzyme
MQRLPTTQVAPLLVPDRWLASSLAGMASLPEAARKLIEAARLGHMVTLNADGSAQVTCVWVGLDGDHLLTAHLSGQQQKLRNVQRDPRVVVSFEGEGKNAAGMQDYLVVRGRAHVEVGGAPELLQRLAQTYVGAGTKFPPMDNPPSGYVLRIIPEHVSGHGPWSS